MLDVRHDPGGWFTEIAAGTQVTASDTKPAERVLERRGKAVSHARLTDFRATDSSILANTNHVLLQNQLPDSK